MASIMLMKKPYFRFRDKKKLCVNVKTLLNNENTDSITNHRSKYEIKF